MKILNIVFVFSLVLLAACSETPLMPVVTNKATSYFPMKQGNYWIYETTMLDTNGKPTSEVYIDSTIINGKKTLGGMEFNSFETYRNGNKVLEEYWSVDDERIYQFRNEKADGISDLKDTIYIMGDFKLMQWPIFYHNIDSIDYEWKGIKGWAKIDFNINGRRVLLYDSVDVNNKNYKSFMFVCNADARYQFHHSSDWLLTRLRTKSIQYAENIGPAAITKNSSYFNIQFQVKDNWEQGYRKKLIRYKVN